MAMAIELYRKAYNLDYRKGDWQAAQTLYKEIVENFPYSDEKEYALVHLERIEKLMANPRNQRLQPVHASGSPAGGFTVFTFFLALVALLAAAAAGYLLYKGQQDIRYMELVVQGSLSERTGNFAQSVGLYTEAQNLAPAKPLAHQLLAELYLGRSEYQHADDESKRWSRAMPENPAIAEFRMRLRGAQEAAAQNGGQQ